MCGASKKTVCYAGIADGDDIYIYIWREIEI